jgi:hypothetical protein
MNANYKDFTTQIYQSFIESSSTVVIKEENEKGKINYVIDFLDNYDYHTINKNMVAKLCHNIWLALEGTIEWPTFQVDGKVDSFLIDKHVLINSLFELIQNTEQRETLYNNFFVHFGADELLKSISGIFSSEDNINPEVISFILKKIILDPHKDIYLLESTLSQLQKLDIELYKNYKNEIYDLLNSYEQIIDAQLESRPQAYNGIKKKIALLIKAKERPEDWKNYQKFFTSGKKINEVGVENIELFNEVNYQLYPLGIAHLPLMKKYSTLTDEVDINDSIKLVVEAINEVKPIEQLKEILVFNHLEKDSSHVWLKIMKSENKDNLENLEVIKNRTQYLIECAIEYHQNLILCEIPKDEHKLSLKKSIPAFNMDGILSNKEGQAKKKNKI